MSIAHKHPITAVRSIVAGYALLAGLWILLSDRAIGMLFRDPDALVRASVVKGWIFIAVTCLLLYGVLRRWTAALIESHRRELALERERQQPQPMLLAIAEASTDGIFAKDEQGRYVLFNLAAARFLGKRPSDVLGRDASALFPPELAQRLMAQDQRIIETGQTETTEEALQVATGEHVFLTTKGPLRGADGKIFGTYGISRDITKRKQEEEALRQVADDLSATLQAMPDLMFELDAEGRYLSARSLNASLLAAPPGQLLGRTVHEVLPAEAADAVMQAVAAAARAGSDFGRTIALPLASAVLHFELSVARRPPLAGQGERFVVLSRDVTARKAVEAELRHRNEELEHFNRAVVERETRMVALKREVNEMALAAGRPAPYDISFADPSVVPAAP